MSDGALVLLLALELEHDGLVRRGRARRWSLLPERCRRRAGLDGIAVDHRQYAAELNFRANVARQRFHFNGFAWRDAILLPARFDDCVHNRPLSLSSPFWRCFRFR